MRRTVRFTDALSAHRKGLVLAGSTAALLGVGAGTASAATVAPAPHVSAESAGSTAAAFRKASTADVALLTAALEKGPASLVKPASHVAAHRVHSLKPAASRVAARDVAAKPAAPKAVTWAQAAEIQAHRNDPKLSGTSLPAADQLRPVAVFGQQETMQLSPAQVANATTIVKQALAKNMGVRSAVIAVATSMQESELNEHQLRDLGLARPVPAAAVVRLGHRAADPGPRVRGRRVPRPRCRHYQAATRTGRTSRCGRSRRACRRPASRPRTPSGRPRRPAWCRTSRPRLPSRPNPPIVPRPPRQGAGHAPRFTPGSPAVAARPPGGPGRRRSGRTSPRCRPALVGHPTASSRPSPRR